MTLQDSSTKAKQMSVADRLNEFPDHFIHCHKSHLYNRTEMVEKESVNRGDTRNMLYTRQLKKQTFAKSTDVVKVEEKQSE